jgi:hypothetical protein
LQLFFWFAWTFVNYTASHGELWVECNGAPDSLCEKGTSLIAGIPTQTEDRLDHHSTTTESQAFVRHKRRSKD